MEAVEEPVNWSAVACRAFEQVLADIIKRKGARDMKDTIQRLKASKHKVNETRLKEGFDAGQRWAQNSAEADELERLSGFYESCHRDSWGWEGLFDLPECASAYSAAERIAFVILGGEHDGDRGAASDFWEEAVDWEEAVERKDHPANEFVRGFAEGALEVWDQVKDLI
jgi:hypothetical protein